MASLAEPPAPAAGPGGGQATAPAPPGQSPETTVQGPLARAEGVELLGAVHGSGYKEGAALVRRGDGQMVHLGPLMYAVLEAVDGERDGDALATAVSERLGRRVGIEHINRLATKLARQGLLEGTEHLAPPRRNPLLALRWKVLVTNPVLTKRLTAPLTFLFRPWIVVPVLLAFGAVFWFVLFHKGVASATAQAFRSPGLLLLVFVLAVASAGFHELGHAAACRYGGATPGGMGMGMYLVWPAFYTDVTDAYRLPRAARLRVDLGGLYFNAVVAVLTMGLWLVWRADALLLLIALQVLQMVKQLSPVIRADGYHILADTTGVPDLFQHMGPTLRRLIPWREREPSALTGRARIVVTLWVLIVVPVLLSLMLSAVLLLPRLLTSAWDSGRMIVSAIPHQFEQGQILEGLASCVRLLALFLPVLGSVLVTQKVVRTSAAKARAWSAGDPLRQAVVAVAGTAIAAGLVWAWWPSGQYQPVRGNENGTVLGMIRLVSAPTSAARPNAHINAIGLSPGTHLAVAMIPVGGATRAHPALFVIPGAKGKQAVAIVSGSSPDPAKAKGRVFEPAGQHSVSGSSATSPSGNSTATTQPTGSGASSSSSTATAFPFKLPAKPGPGGTQAVATNTQNGGVTYDVAYSLVTVTGGAPVTNTNSAYALAHCVGCTTVAVSFQVVLVVGQSKIIAPINAAGSLNYECPACTTTALADQIVVTLQSAPSGALLAALSSDLAQLNALSALGAGGTPAAIAASVATVQREVENQLNSSGLLSQPLGSSTPTPSSSQSSGSSGSQSQTGASSSSSTSSGTGGQSSSGGSSSAGSASAGSTPATSSGSSGAPATTTPAAPSPSSAGADTTSTATSTTPSP